MGPRGRPPLLAAALLLAAGSCTLALAQDCSVMPGCTACTDAALPPPPSPPPGFNFTPPVLVNCSACSAGYELVQRGPALLGICECAAGYGRPFNSTVFPPACEVCPAGYYNPGPQAFNGTEPPHHDGPDGFFNGTWGDDDDHHGPPRGGFFNGSDALNGTGRPPHGGPPHGFFNGTDGGFNGTDRPPRDGPPPGGVNGTDSPDAAGRPQGGGPPGGGPPGGGPPGGGPPGMRHRRSLLACGPRCQRRRARRAAKANNGTTIDGTTQSGTTSNGTEPIHNGTQPLPPHDGEHRGDHGFGGHSECRPCPNGTSPNADRTACE